MEKEQNFIKMEKFVMTDIMLMVNQKVMENYIIKKEFGLKANGKMDN